jgi:hypothetical protein
MIAASIPGTRASRAIRKVTPVHAGSRIAKGRAATSAVFSSGGGCVAGSISDFAEQWNYLAVPVVVPVPVPVVVPVRRTSRRSCRPARRTSRRSCRPARRS